MSEPEPIINEPYRSRLRDLEQETCPAWCVGHVEMYEPAPARIHAGRRRVVWCPGWPAGTRIELHAERHDVPANEWTGNPHVIMTGVMLYGASLTLEATQALITALAETLTEVAP
ncbi:MAG TPA: hypothetical protein VD864_11575 [Nocardioides sp.]|nr:hypothetical protein [Nocardioides sp.]